MYSKYFPPTALTTGGKWHLSSVLIRPFSPRPARTEKTTFPFPISVHLFLFEIKIWKNIHFYLKLCYKMKYRPEVLTKVKERHLNPGAKYILLYTGQFILLLGFKQPISHKSYWNIKCLRIYLSPSFKQDLKCFFIVLSSCCNSKWAFKMIIKKLKETFQL